MAQINYKYIGWCKEDSHDKVWTTVLLSPEPKTQYFWGLKYERAKWVTIWGRRGKKLSHKVFEGQYGDMEKTIQSKQKKGYQKIGTTELGNVYPEFESDLEKTTVWLLLTQ